MTARTGPAGQTGRTRLILVRHAATDVTGRTLSGRSDPPLGALGRRQAVATGRRVATLAPEAAEVVTSPLVRCRQTAQVLGDALAVPVRAADDLAEADFGAWEGHSFAEIADRWPTRLADWLSDLTVAPPAGESFAHVAARLLPVLLDARRRHQGGTVVLVGHASLVKLALDELLGVGKRFLDAIQVDPASLSIVDGWPDGGQSVPTINDTAHL